MIQHSQQTREDALRHLKRLRSLRGDVKNLQCSLIENRHGLTWNFSHHENRKIAIGDNVDFEPSMIVVPDHENEVANVWIPSCLTKEVTMTFSRRTSVPDLRRQSHAQRCQARVVEGQKSMLSDQEKEDEHSS